MPPSRNRRAREQAYALWQAHPSMTRAELARRVDVTHTTVSRWVREWVAEVDSVVVHLPPPATPYLELSPIEQAALNVVELRTAIEGALDDRDAKAIAALYNRLWEAQARHEALVEAASPKFDSHDDEQLIERIVVLMSKSSVREAVLERLYG